MRNEIGPWLKAGRALLLLCGYVCLGDVKQGTNTLEFAENAPILDGDKSGRAFVQTITTSLSSISELKVSFDLSGQPLAFNGDFYVRLTHNGKSAILLNRVGRPEWFGLGYSDNGFDVMFDDNATNGDVHVYQQTVIPGEEPLTGTWAPDGRNTDPKTVVVEDPRTAFLASFIGDDPNGTWVLFVADMSSGGEGRLMSWGLTITGPEVLTAPRIVSQPENILTNGGSNVSFGITAEGATPMAYQWFCNDSSLPAATNDTLMLTNVEFANRGAYLVVVTNVYGSATSQVANLELLFSLNVTASGGGSVARLPDTSTFPASTLVELRAIADPGFAFSEWSGDLAGSSNPRLISMDRNYTMTALFTPILDPIPAQIIDEGRFWALAVTGSNSPPAGVNYFLLSGPQGADLNPFTGVLTWTPSEEQGPSTNQVMIKVVDITNPLLCSTNSFTVIVNEVNTPPTLIVPVDQWIDELTTLIVTNLASDVDIPPNSVVFWLISGPEGMSLNAKTGVLTWTPAEVQGPSTNWVTIGATDDGSPNLGSTNSFLIVVREVNSAPLLVVPSYANVDELSTLSLTNAAIDADVPTNSLTFALVSAPAGVSIDPQSGILVWRPTEEQGPSTNQVVIKVTDNGSPPLSATNSITVVVNEVNTPPTLIVPPNQTIDALSVLVLTNRATDLDLPANTLTFALLSGPAGMVIDPTSGVLTWTPSEAQADHTNIVFVKVSDDGIPSLSDSISFVVVVKPKTPPPAPNILSISLDDSGLVTLRWQSIAGMRYRMEAKDRLTDTTWTSLGEIQAKDALSVFTETPANQAQRFYRVVMLY